MKLPFNNLRGGRSGLALRHSSSYSSNLRLEQLEERRLLAVAPLEFDDIEAAPADASAAFLGPNLIVNGGFDLAIDGVTGWLTPEGGVTTEVVDGNRVAHIVRSAVDPPSQILQEVAVSSNTTYQIEFDLITVSNGAGTRVDFNVFTTSGNLLAERIFAGGNEHYGFELPIGADGDAITVQFIAGRLPRDFTVDNVSVREFVNVPINGGLGPELINSGTLDTEADLQADWATPNGGVQWDAGTARVVRLSGQPPAKFLQGIATNPATAYVIEFDLIASGASGSDVQFQLFEGDPAGAQMFSVSFSSGDRQHHVFEVTAGPAVDAFTLQFKGNTVNRAFTVDNVSVREEVSVPRELGVELVANGSFDSAGGGFDDLSGWRAVGNSVTWDNGAARVNRISGDPLIEQTISTDLGAVHRVEFTLSGAAAGEATVAVLDGDGGILAVGAFGNGSHGFDVTSTDKFLTVRAAASSPGGNFTLDNVSVRITELPPDPDAGNLVTNGRFNRDDQLDGWLVSNPAGVSWALDEAPDDVDDGVARITSLHPNINDPSLPPGAFGANIQQQIDVSPSLQHRLEFDLITSNIGGGTRVDLLVFAGNVGGAQLLNERLFSGEPHRIFSFISPADGPITIQFKASLANKDFTVDNVSLQELIRKPFDVSGFEAVEGYFAGPVDGQDGWTSIVDPAEGAHSSPLISSDNPNSGSQHLRIEQNVSLPAVDSDNAGPFNGAISGANTVEPGVFGMSIDVAISARNGADYDVIAQATSRNDVTWQVRFESTGAILAAGDVGRGRELIDTGFTWSPGAYRALDVVVDPGEDRIIYQYNGIEIYSTEGSGGVFGSDIIEEVILKSNNAHHEGDFADFDNLTIANLSGGTIQPPDLAGAVPGGWSGSIVTSNVLGTNIDTPIIDPGETIFADFAVSNIGLFDAGEYSAQWTILNDVDGTVRTGEISGGVLVPLGTEMFPDVNIGLLPAGEYTVSFDIDFEGAVVEGNEDNNTVLKALTIGTTDEGIIDAEAFSRFGPLGGLISVSDGTLGRINAPGDSDDVSFSGQVGETISAMVTPIDPAARLSLRLNGAAVAGPGAPGAAVFMSPRGVTFDGLHTLSVSGTAAATDYEVRLVRNATIEMADSSIGSGLSLDSSSVLGRTGVLAKTHSGADIDEFTVSLTVGHRVDVVLDGVTADFSGQTLRLFNSGGALLATGTNSPQGPIATNLDLAIHDFVVPANGIYTVRVNSSLSAGLYYTVVATDNLALESEGNNDAGSADGLRRLNIDTGNILVGQGFLSDSDSEIRRLFAVDASTDEFVEVDPDSGAEIQRFSLPSTIIGGGEGLAFDGSSLFYASDEVGQRTLYEINPDTHAVIDSDSFASIGLGDAFGGLGVVGGHVVVLDGLNITVQSIDTNTDQLVGPPLELQFDSTLLLGPLNGITGADSRGSIFSWSFRFDSSLSVAIVEFDATTGELLGEFDGPSDNGFLGLAFIGDELFALDSANTVHRINPDSGAVLDSFSLEVLPSTRITALGYDVAAAAGADTFTFLLGVGESLTASTETPFNDSLDPRLVIFNSGGVEVGSDSNSADGRNASLTLLGLPAGLYRIQVQAESGEGEYRLNVSTGDLVPVLNIVPVNPDPRNTSVNSILFSFNTEVTGFALEDWRLTRDGGGNLLPGGASLVAAGGNNFTLNGIAGLTAADGVYVLAVVDTGSPIQDLSGQALAAPGLEQWTMDTVAPVVTVADVSTEDVSPQLSGTVDDDSLAVSVTVDGNTYAATVAAGGAWTLPGGTIAPDLAPGTYEVTASATDPAGNTGSDNSTDELEITGGDGLAADLTGDGFVDFQDLTILLANWNLPVAAIFGNLIDPLNTLVDFQDLTSLLAQWTGPGPVGAAEPAAVASESAATDAAITEIGTSAEDSLTAEDRPSQSDDARVGRRQSSLRGTRRSLRTAAIDAAFADDSDGALSRRSRHGRSGRRTDG